MNFSKMVAAHKTLQSGSQVELSRKCAFLKLQHYVDSVKLDRHVVFLVSQDATRSDVNSSSV